MRHAQHLVAEHRLNRAFGGHEIGRYIDFHATDGSSIDYTNRLDAGTSGNITLNGYKIWHAGNDGAGSGLDADLLDGQQGSYYLNYNNLTNTPTAGISAAEGQRKAILAAKIFGRF